MSRRELSMRTLVETNGHSGADLPELEPAEAPDRKERKRDAKRRRDAQRPPDSFERFKILLEVIGEQRQVVNLEDHRSRYGLVLMGTINAALYLLVSRVAGNQRPVAASPWVMGVVLLYIAVSLAFILTAIDGLRPRSLRRRCLLHWEGAVMYTLPEYQAAWSDVRMDQLNREGVATAHTLARLIQEKYRANERLYRGLAVLIVLGAVLLTVIALVFMIR